MSIPFDDIYFNFYLFVCLLSISDGVIVSWDRRQACACTQCVAICLLRHLLESIENDKQILRSSRMNWFSWMDFIDTINRMEKWAIDKNSLHMSTRSAADLFEQDEHKVYLYTNHSEITLKLEIIIKNEFSGCNGMAALFCRYFWTDFPVCWRGQMVVTQLHILHVILGACGNWIMVTYPNVACIRVSTFFVTNSIQLKRYNDVSGSGYSKFR